MAASLRLPVALLSSAVVVLMVLAWKPWRSPHSPAPMDEASEAFLDAALKMWGVDTAPIGQTLQLTAQQQRGVISERVRDATPYAQPPQRYPGPNGQQYEIVYSQELVLPSDGHQELKRQRQQQMRGQPDAIVNIYGLGRDDIAAVLAGTRHFPTG